MPIYEFLCPECNNKSSILIRAGAKSFRAKCPVCGSGELTRVMSSFAYHRSLQTIHEQAGEPQRSPSPDYYKDPRNIGRWAEKRFDELGVEMPHQAQEMIQAAREGELPGPLKDL